MRVLLITRKWPPAVGGMETYSREMAHALGELAEVNTVALPGRRDGRPPKWQRLPGFFVRAAVVIARRGRRYDAVLLGDPLLGPLALVAAIAAPNARVVVATHGTDVTLDRNAGVTARVYRLYLRLLARMAGLFDAVIANSRATAAHARRIGLSRIAVIPLGVRAVTHEQPVTSPEPYVLFVGRFETRKGAGWFARAVVPHLPHGMRFVAVGPAWDPAETRAIDAQPRAERRPPAFGANLAALRRHATVVVVPNVPAANRGFEGFGLTALEGAADGGIVLASDMDGIPDAVADGGIGFVLPSGDAGAWAAKIEEVAGWSAETRQRWLQGSIERIRERFTWERVAKDTLAVMRDGAGI